MVPLSKVTDPVKSIQPIETEPENIISQDNKKDDLTVTSEPTNIEPKPVVLELLPVVVSSHLDVNTTNKITHQTVTQSETFDKKDEDTSTAQISVEAENSPPDSFKNSTNEKSIPSIDHDVRAAQLPNQEKEKSITSVAAPIEKEILVIDYFDGQWSPNNTKGRKYYTRDQILKLKNQLTVAKLPDNIAAVLLKKEKVFDPVKSIAPRFMKNQMNPQNSYQKRSNHPENNNQALIESRSSKPGIIELKLGIRDSVKLNQADNAWKPSHLAEKQDLTEEDRVTHDLLGRYRSMLNKLTADNFNFLVDQIKLYKIDTSERLDGVIRLIFEKAISEPNFAPTYAKLCKEVSFITTASSEQGEENTSKSSTLKMKLVTQCQMEFERHKEESLVFDDIEAKLREIENHPDKEKRVEVKSRLEEEHYRYRQRANGTVKFIGELFKLNMLTTRIMRSCIDLLLLEATEEKIERVCKLLTTVGRKLEEDDSRQSLDNYFEQLKKMMHPSHKVIKTSRIKFEIQNLQDLRNRGWQSRQKDNTPKTMNQIQKEADNEQRFAYYQTRENIKDDRRRGGNQDGYDNQGGYDNRRQHQQQNQNEDKWSMQQQNNKMQYQDNGEWSVHHNKKSRTQPIALSKIIIPPTNSDGPKSFGYPNKYKNFSAKSSNLSASRVDTKMDGPRRYEGGGSKNSSMERSGNRDRNYGNANYSDHRNSSQHRSRDSSLQAPQRQHQAPFPSISSSISFSSILKLPPKVTPKAPVEPISFKKEEKNFEKMLSIFDLYYKDELKLELAIAQLGPLNVNKDVIVKVYNMYLDRKEIDRESLMILICEMLKKKILTFEDNRDALKETMTLAPDIACDVPRVYEYIAQFFGDFFPL